MHREAAFAVDASVANVMHPSTAAPEIRPIQRFMFDAEHSRSPW
jgi:hypothetical protein